jgi:hypothetical protein
MTPEAVQPPRATLGARLLEGLGLVLLAVDRLAAAALVAGAAWVAFTFLTLAWRESAWMLLVAVPAVVSVPVLAWHFLVNPRLGGSPALGPGHRRVTITPPGDNAAVKGTDVGKGASRRNGSGARTGS